MSNIAHKLAAGLTGCVSAAAKKQDCQAGAVGSIIGEMVGDWLVTEKLKQIIESGEIKLGSDEYNKLLNTIKITAGAIALLYDFDVDTAANEALVAVENNALVKSDDIKTFICIIIHFAPLDLQQLAMQSYINGNMSAMNMLA